MREGMQDKGPSAKHQKALGLTLDLFFGEGDGVLKANVRFLGFLVGRVGVGVGIPGADSGGFVI